ncbi:hypothetical protein [Antarctobacter heliothermus]|nr:hypothetical protein [Antarctobacter heliothermus]
MSDPVTNVEIEDVLSSIRRLVSEEERPPRGAQRSVPERLVLSPALRVPDAADPPTKAPGRGREAHAPMVLTEPSVTPVAHRPPPPPTVPEPDEIATLVLGAEDSAEATAPEPADTQVAETVDPLAVWSADPDGTSDKPIDLAPALPEDDLGEADAALVPVDPDADQMIADDADLTGNVTEDIGPEEIEPEDIEHDTEAGQIAALRASLSDILAPDPGAGDDDVLETADDPNGYAAQLFAHADVDVDSGTDTELDRKIATLEQMLARQSQDWAPTTPSADDTDPSEPSEAAVAPTADPDDATAMGDGADVTSDGADDADTALQEVVSAVAGAVSDDPLNGAGPVDPSPDMATAIPDGDISAVDALEPEDSAETPAATSAVPGDARPAFVRHAPSEALDWEDHAPGADSLPDPVPEAEPDQSAAVTKLSEEALQAIVSEIVRQELQGALGERITRNVRKLVRREIHRVLMSKDLD